MNLSVACQWHLYYAGMHGGPVGVSVRFWLFPRLWPENFLGSDGSKWVFRSNPLLPCTSVPDFQGCKCSIICDRSVSMAQIRVFQKANLQVWFWNSQCSWWYYKEKWVLSTTGRERNKCFNQKNKDDLGVLVSNRVSGENLLFFN